jgi:hypothetical protein
MIGPILVSLVTVAAPAAQPAAQRETDLIPTLAALERRAWQARASHDPTALAGLLTNNYQELFPFESGRTTRAGLLKGLAAQHFSRPVLRGFRAETITPKVVILTYDLEIRGPVGGTELPPQQLAVSATWVRQGDRWQSAFRQGTPRPRPAPAETIRDVGIQFSPDTPDTLLFRYQGEQPLEDVHATITLTFADGATVSLDRYWGVWRAENVRAAHLFLARATITVERVRLTGQAMRDGRPVELATTVRR